MPIKRGKRGTTRATKGSISGDGPATAEQLWALWQLLMKAILELMERPEQLKADQMNVIRMWLKDNHVSIHAAHEADIRESLVKLQALSVPFDVPT